IDKVPEWQKTFLREGCLLILLAISLNPFNWQTSAVEKFIDQASPAVEKCPTESDREIKLLKAVKLAFSLLKAGKRETEELASFSHWAHREIVRGYFEEKAREFQTEFYQTSDPR